MSLEHSLKELVRNTEEHNSIVRSPSVARGKLIVEDLVNKLWKTRLTPVEPCNVVSEVLLVQDEVTSSMSFNYYKSVRMYLESLQEDSLIRKHIVLKGKLYRKAPSADEVEISFDEVEKIWQYKEFYLHAFVKYVHS